MLVYPLQAEGLQPFPANQGTPLAFETDLFVGNMSFLVAGLPTSPPNLFAGQKRLSHLVIQARYILTPIEV